MVAPLINIADCTIRNQIASDLVNATDIRISCGTFCRRLNNVELHLWKNIKCISLQTLLEPGTLHKATGPIDESLHVF